MTNIRTLFRVFGPRTIPTYRGKASRTITDEDVRAFWKSNADIALMRGCYVFGMRVGRATKPAYVGRATRTFRQEVFQYHKLTRYLQQLAEYRVGVPVLFFVALTRRRGAPPTTHIVELERFLIANASAVNPQLLNVRCKPTRAWSIAGVVSRDRGKPSVAAKDFQALMRFA